MTRIYFFLFLIASTIATFIPLKIDANDVPRLASIKAGAEAGNPQAQLEFANTFSNSSEFEAWLRKSANQGYPPAMDQLAAFLLNRIVGRMKWPPSHTEGVVWAARAADSGQARSARLLSEAYHRGMGIEKDPRIAYTWLLVAQRFPAQRPYLSTIERELLQILSLEEVRKAQSAESAFRPHQGIAWQTVITSIVTERLAFTGALQRQGETIALINGNPVSEGQRFSITLASTVIPVTCTKVNSNEVQLSIQNLSTPVIIRRQLQ